MVRPLGGPVGGLVDGAVEMGRQALGVQVHRAAVQVRREAVKTVQVRREAGKIALVYHAKVAGAVDLPVLALQNQEGLSAKARLDVVPRLKKRPPPIWHRPPSRSEWPIIAKNMVTQM